MANQDIHLVENMSDDRPRCGRSLSTFLRSTDFKKATCRECLHYFSYRNMRAVKEARP